MKIRELNESVTSEALAYVNLAKSSGTKIDLGKVRKGYIIVDMDGKSISSSAGSFALKVTAVDKPTQSTYEQWYVKGILLAGSGPYSNDEVGDEILVRYSIHKDMPNLYQVKEPVASKSAVKSGSLLIPMKAYPGGPPLKFPSGNPSLSFDNDNGGLAVYYDSDDKRYVVLLDVNDEYGKGYVEDSFSKMVTSEILAIQLGELAAKALSNSRDAALQIAKTKGFREEG